MKLCMVDVTECLNNPELIDQATEQLVQIRQRLRTAQDRQKNYVDNHL